MFIPDIVYERGGVDFEFLRDVLSTDLEILFQRGPWGSYGSTAIENV